MYNPDPIVLAKVGIIIRRSLLFVSRFVLSAFCFDLPVIIDKAFIFVFHSIVDGVAFHAILCAQRFLCLAHHFLDAVAHARHCLILLCLPSCETFCFWADEGCS